MSFILRSRNVQELEWEAIFNSFTIYFNIDLWQIATEYHILVEICTKKYIIPVTDVVG